MPARARHLITTLCLAAAILSPATASAQEGFSDGWQPEPDVVDYSDSFVGQFTGLDARFLLSNAEGEGLEGWGIDAGARFSFPIYLGDIRLAYRYDELGDANAEGGALQTHSAGATFALHPGYILLLGSDWLSYVAASFYLDAGLGAQFSELRVGDETQSSPGFYWNWGGGVDIPLWDPDVGWAPWVNVSYRNHRGLGPDGLGDARWESTHSLMLGLGFRVNRLLW